ncbi:uncharacterized protein LOC126803828 [Argentina anserina]|uniref:uncharacterized protein LOC126803828 n=1 Tax=Argentina anserina TaxID=57926 RepID=UPI00217656CB|nr:uncharacterized protein LOC126803828 [Potentilla anserina]
MGWGGRASKRGYGDGGQRERDTTTSGCMCAVFQFFDFHQLQFPNLHQQQHSLRPEDLTIPKGVEAPRNSLDSSEGGASLSSITKEEESLHSPILKIQQIKTSGGTVSDSSSCSPGTKTPSLVARLMGLDLLPESHSPSSTSSLTPNPHSISKPHLNLHPLRSSRQTLQNTKDNNAAGTRSLPETPRISSARRSDVDHHHRLSLQINKENISVGEELEFSKLSSFKRKELLKSIIGDNESGRSPSHYARQIVKQVKETVSRKVGLVDITNTTRNDRDLLSHQLKSRKATQDANAGKPAIPSSCSPRLRLSEAKAIKPNNTNTTSTTCKDQLQVLPPKPNSAKVQAKPKPQPAQEQKPPQATLIQKRRKIVDEGFSPAKLKKQEEAFVRPSTAPTRAQQQCKKTQLISNNLLNLHNVPTLLPIKKDPSPPASKLPQKQLSSSTSQQLQDRYKIDQASSSSPVLAARCKNVDVVPNCLAATRTTGAGVVVGISAAVRQYVTRILCRTGIDKDTQVSFTNWFSPSHPLDPSIFYHLETSVASFTSNHPSQLGLRCNRKLVFHVVDEILVEILRPYLNLKPWVSSTSVTQYGYKGSKLIDVVCYKLQSFPGADCRVLEDIDALIDEDLPEAKVQSVMALAFEEEGEGVVREIEKDILDTLVHETAMCLRF